MDTWENSPVFIVGHPKSGTSLLNSLLDGHPQLVVLPEESDYYYGIWPYANMVNKSWRESDKTKSEKLLERVLNYSHIKNFFRGKVDQDISGNLDYSNFQADKFKELLARAFKKSKFKRNELLVDIINSYANTVFSTEELKAKIGWVEKTPKHLQYLNEIRQDFPSARFIFVHRDPRDNFVSYKKKWEQSLTSLKFAKNWNGGFEEINKVPKESVLFIKYEALVDNPKAELDKIIGFLGIKDDEKLLTPTKNNAPWLGNSLFGDKMATVSGNAVGRFKEKLSEADLLTIEAFCQDNMKKGGYSFVSQEEARAAARKDNAEKYAKALSVFNRKQPFSKKLGLMKRMIIGKI